MPPAPDLASFAFLAQPPERRRGRRGALATGAMLALAAVAMLLWFGHGSPPAQAPAMRTAAAPPSEPAPPALVVPMVAPVRDSLPTARTRHRPRASSPIRRSFRRNRPNRYIAEPLTGRALRRALVRDRRLTQEANAREIARMSGLP